ncbi:MAG: ectoine/hydroxyectoine ABC transporter substrate-binding protein EhuB, partial [Paracoccaceae bacterium]|nr:ectoine/hydroxyectoine ABC transporter substrate-binding protein EhuB [Paracoccaceae bacterium]
MTHTFKLAALSVSALALTSGALAAATLDEIRASGTIRIAVANEIPYGYVDPNGQALGAGPDVAKAIVAKLGIANIEWVTTGFSSLIPGLKADRFDMVAAEMAILPERCNAVLFSEPNTSYGEGLLVAAGNPKGITSYGDFAEKPGLKVAIMAGADQLEMMQELGVDDTHMVMISANADAIS